MDIQKIILEDQWQFHLGDIPDAWSKSYQITQDWSNVTIPHDWSVSQPFSESYSSGTGYLSGGTSWYRCSFHLDEKYRGHKISVVFDGVYKNSQVWLNSYYNGIWPYGYTTFRYDITQQACFGADENLLCVKVSHPDISDSRWFTGSGITRKVTIVIEDLVHPKADGIFFESKNVFPNSADVLITNEISNDSTTAKNVTVKNTLVDSDSQEVLSVTSSLLIPAHEMRTIQNKSELSMPDLWSPFNPSLYTLKTYLSTHELTEENNHEWYLADTKKVGIRSIYFDPNTGFHLNGLSTKLKGVCLHHDAGCLGAAVLPNVWKRRLVKLKTMGCNAIRMSHNPHMPELYDLCDAMGFLVMDEAFDEWEGAKNKWSTGHNVYPPKHQGYFENFHDWHERDLMAMVRRGRNHPSIILWSIGNEIDYPNDPYCHPLFLSMTGNNDHNKPTAELQYSPNKPNAERLGVIATRLTSIVKHEDSTRPVILASAFPELSSQIGLFDSLDMIGYNYKEHLYEQDHLRFPELPILGSENSHGYKQWLSVTQNEYIAGQFLWTGIDYLGEAHGWPIHGSGAGLLTLAGFEKWGYYRRKSLWSKKPCLHLVTNRLEEIRDEWTPMFESWNYVPGEMIEVRCYTNQLFAELSLNGESFGKKEFEEEVGYIVWKLPFQEGQLKAVTSIDELGTSIEDTLVTTFCASNIQLTLVDLPNLDIQDESLQNQSLLQIEATVLDQHAHRVVSDTSLLFVTVEENGNLIGLENGDLGDVTCYTSKSRRTLEGRLLIYVRKLNSSQPTIIRVTGSHLKTGYITI